MAEISASLAVISVILCTIVLGTIIGNIFVIVAILIDKNLQTSANQLVLSLAVADLMVACLVMPLGAYNDLRQGWYLGTLVCEFWTSADVLCCTGKSVDTAYIIASLPSTNFNTDSPPPCSVDSEPACDCARQVLGGD